MSCCSICDITILTFLQWFLIWQIDIVFVSNISKGSGNHCLLWQFIHTKQSPYDTENNQLIMSINTIICYLNWWHNRINYIYLFFCVFYTKGFRHMQSPFNSPICQKKINIVESGHKSQIIISFLWHFHLRDLLYIYCILGRSSWNNQL